MRMAKKEEMNTMMIADFIFGILHIKRLIISPQTYRNGFKKSNLRPHWGIHRFDSEQSFLPHPEEWGVTLSNESKNKRGRFFIPSPFIWLEEGLDLLHHSIAAPHLMATTKTTTHSIPLPKLGDLLGCEKLSSLQLILDYFVFHLILKVS